MTANRARAPAADPLAVRLAVAIKRLRARFREAAWAGGVELPIAQVAVIKRLRNDGPTTASALAAAEHVTHQAITQTLAALKRAGLVRSEADPTDGRKSVISVTPAGNRLFESAIASRDAWLARAIESVVSPRERAALEKSIELLERLAAPAVPSPSQPLTMSTSTPSSVRRLRRSRSRADRARQDLPVARDLQLPALLHRPADLEYGQPAHERRADPVRAQARTQRACRRRARRVPVRAAGRALGVGRRGG